SAKDYLGIFEFTVTAALLHLRDKAYGMTIRREIEEGTGREVAIGAVYATLDRLEEKDYIKATVGEATAERGGGGERHFRVTAAGIAAFADAQKALSSMTRGLQPAPLGAR